jgi:hypothetical protein
MPTYSRYLVSLHGDLVLHVKVMHFARNNLNNSCQLFKNKSPHNISEMVPGLPLQTKI